MSTGPAQIDLRTDPWFHRAILSLWIAGVGYVLLAIASTVLIPIVEAPEGKLLPALAVTALCLGLPTALIGVANFACARALEARRPWGFVVGVILGALYAPSCCLPLGGVLLYALLRPGVKQAYDQPTAG